MANQVKIKKVDEIYEQYALDPATHETALWQEALKHLQWIVGQTEERREDIVQDALIYAASHIDSYDPARSSFGHWLRIIGKSTQNRAWQKLTIERKRTEQPARLSEDDFFGDIDAMRQDNEDDGEDPDLNAIVARELVRDLFNDDLPLVAALAEEKSVTDAAKRLGRSRDAVRWAIKKAKERYAEAV